jgi:hypothetical protein
VFGKAAINIGGNSGIQCPIPASYYVQIPITHYNSLQPYGIVTNFKASHVFMHVTGQISLTRIQTGGFPDTMHRIQIHARDHHYQDKRDDPFQVFFHISIILVEVIYHKITGLLMGTAI